MGTIKDRNSNDLTESEEIKKEVAGIHRRTLQKKIFMTQITHLEPEVLECEVRWGLESITKNKASGGDGIPAELFQILKDDPFKVLYSI